MSRIENQSLRILAPPLLFIGASWLAGSTRLIQYFPGASQKSLVLSAVLGGATVVGSELIRERCDLNRLVCVIAAIALSTIVSPYAAKALNGGAKMTLQASLRFAVVEAAIAGGFEFIPSLQ